MDVSRSIKAIAIDVGETAVRLDLGLPLAEIGQLVLLPAYKIDEIFALMITYLELGINPVSSRRFHGQDRRERNKEAEDAIFEFFLQKANDSRHLRGMEPLPASKLLKAKILWLACRAPLHFDPQRYEFLKKISERYRIVFVTDMNPATLYRLLIVEPFRKLFELGPVVASCEVGALKPDGRIWEKTIKEAGAEPEECIYVDNMKMAVDAWISYWTLKERTSMGIWSQPFNFPQTMRLLAEAGVVWEGM